MTSIEASIYLCEVCKNIDCNLFNTQSKWAYCKDFIRDEEKEKRLLESIKLLIKGCEKE